ncbi:MAG: CBS domain-containing protein [Gammaproteobacteria bacterium]|nr:CBS domain-containing protein [Gammaproteobacteria bacterium]MDH5729376.1 CBS domain-containing protein [Gammaproteobacteria bacterium]
MKSVEKLLEKKDGQVWSIGPDDTVFDAIKLMHEKSVGALAVVVSQDKLIGIISERDYAGKVILQGKSSKNTAVREIMSSKVHYALPDQEVSECLVRMNKHRIRHLPVIVDEKLVGMISMGDVVKEIIEEQSFTIKQLEHHMIWEESY